MIVERTLYALDDVTLIPAIETDIRHRSECKVTYENNKLPIFVSPMDSVIDINNFDLFEKNNLISILPRTESIENRVNYAVTGKWAAFGMEEFEKYFCNENSTYTGPVRVLIDIANGHIKEMQYLIAKAKQLSKDNNYKIEIMAGNVAYPETYKRLAEAGADFIRCSVGSGQCCITTSNTSTNYPLASLIDDCYKLKKNYNLKAAIIADGGINSYSRAIKALALGADYIMIGTTFGKCFESAGTFKSANVNDRDLIDGFELSDLNKLRFDEKISEQTKKEYIAKYKPLIKTIYGMSTRKAQLKIGLAQGKKKEDIKFKTSEGIEREITVEYTINQWVENFVDYLRSAMSYANFTNIKDFVGGPTMMILSESAKNSVNK